MSRWVMLFIICVVCISAGGAMAADLGLPQVIAVDGQGYGRGFEGIGALSAGASSRLLMDYPEPYRSAILDYLFKPKFGASLHVCKVELPGDGNSTDGTEPSHAHTRGEFEHPKPEYFDRGYEWWLMEEAKKRNPSIIFESLQWAAPGWIGNRNFFSQDNADFIAAFIKGARDYHGIRISYQGILNESAFEAEWIKTLRKTLDREGLTDTGIVAADQVNNWDLVLLMQKDAELRKAIRAVGVHYPGFKSSDEAKKIGKSLWASEDGPWRGDWQGACALARMYNRNYAIGRMTKTNIWSPITSYYDCLALPGSGLMRANSPWSGHYDAQPAIWATAHTTQFTQPGWRYLDDACGILDGVGSYVTLRDRTTGDYSIIIETTDAKPESRCDLEFHIGGGLSTGTVHVWRSNEAEQFAKLPDIAPANGSFSIKLDGQSIYTLTTTSGQCKGTAPNHRQSSFPMPYREDFEGYVPGKLPKYFSDQVGSFAVEKRSDGKGQCLRQLVLDKSLGWGSGNDHPLTVLGNSDWTDYEVSSDVYIEGSGSVSILGRGTGTWGAPNGYLLEVNDGGKWELRANTSVLASGITAFLANTWHNLELKLAGTSIIALIDGKKIIETGDPFFRKGLAGVGSGLNYAQFDNFVVRPYTGPKPKPDPRFENLAFGSKVSSSSDWSADYTAGRALDHDLQTRWNSADGKTAGEWLEVDFGKPTTFDKAVTWQWDDRITGYKIQCWDGIGWKDAFTGGKLGTARKVDDFQAVTGSKVRLLVTSTNGGTPTICEFEVYFNNR